MPPTRRQIRPQKPAQQQTTRRFRQAPPFLPVLPCAVPQKDLHLRHAADELVSPDVFTAAQTNVLVPIIAFYFRQIMW